MNDMTTTHEGSGNSTGIGHAAEKDVHVHPTTRIGNRIYCDTCTTHWPAEERSAEKDASCTCVENIQRYATYADLVMRDCPAHPYYPTPCTATYDKSTRRDRADTHTCTLGGGHDGPHFCAQCRSEWTRPLPPGEGRA